jgi:hypothetical protein
MSFLFIVPLLLVITLRKCNLNVGTLEEWELLQITNLKKLLIVSNLSLYEKCGGSIL